MLPMTFTAYPQKSKFRVTLEIDAMDDFNPHNIDWEKVLDVQGNENVIAYIEDLSTPDRW
jgi:predicted component of type VI protein secretion system